MTFLMAQPLDMSDPLLMSDSERHAFLYADPDASRIRFCISKPRANKTGYRGVRFNTWRRTFDARIMKRGKERLIGSFPTAIEAAYAYDAMAMMLHGDSAILNFSREEQVAA